MNESKHRIVFFGTPDFVIPVLEVLFENFDVVGVVTAPDHNEGRKKILTPSPVKQQALDRNISYIFTPQQLTNEVMQQLQSTQPDLYVVAAYGKIIPQNILDLPRFGALNIHPSLLPKYRGPSPIQSALLNGDDITGVSIIKMDEKMDHGPIVYQEEIELKGNETFKDLHHSMFKRAADHLPELINKYIAGEVLPAEQDHNAATFCQIITKEDGNFPNDNPPDPEVLDRMIRAYYPWPTAWTTLQMINGKNLIAKFLPEGKIQLEGGKPMSIKDFLNGHPELQEIIEKLGLRLKT